ncbi:MAG: hypothetical protein HZC17_01580 [Candidatus Omnitrophica bacterium]|nr:hypothetical protein [Candidatus Omnitrophota bacterium]
MNKKQNRKPTSLKGLYRWMKRCYLPALHRRIELLPGKVALLANKVDCDHSPFIVL